MNTIIKKLKPVIWVILLTFGCLGLQVGNFAFALEEQPQRTQRAQKGRGNETAGAKISKEIGDIQRTIKTIDKRIEEDQRFEEELKELNKRLKTLKKLDKEVRKEFKETEKKLKEAGLSERILKRHYDFVKQYEKNIEKLRKHLEEVETAKGAKRKAKSVKRAKEFLEEKVYKPKARPIDPDKLPHRSLPRRSPKVIHEEEPKQPQRPLKEPQRKKEIKGGWLPKKEKSVFASSIQYLASSIENFFVATCQAAEIDLPKN